MTNKLQTVAGYFVVKLITLTWQCIAVAAFVTAPPPFSSFQKCIGCLMFPLSFCTYGIWLGPKKLGEQGQNQASRKLTLYESTYPPLPTPIDTTKIFFLITVNHNCVFITSNQRQDLRLYFELSYVKNFDIRRSLQKLTYAIIQPY